MKRINNIPVFLAPGIGVKNSVAFALRDDVDKGLVPFTITMFQVVEDKTIAMFNAECIVGDRGNQVKRFFVGKAYLRSQMTPEGSIQSNVDIEYDEVV